MYGKCWRFRMPEPAGLVIAWAWTLHLIIAGVDYLAGDGTAITSRFIAVEDALPVQAWGAVYLTTGLVSLIGLVARRPRIFMVGCALAVAIYGAMTVGATIFAVSIPPPHDGVRYISRQMVMALTWVAMGYATKLQIEINRRADEHVNGNVI